MDVGDRTDRIRNCMGIHTRDGGKVLEQAGVKMANAKFPSSRSQDTQEGK